jgi:hypothetical protein
MLSSSLTPTGISKNSTSGGNSRYPSARRQGKRTPNDLKFTRWILDSYCCRPIFGPWDSRPALTGCRRVGSSPGLRSAFTAADEAGAYANGQVENSELRFGLLSSSAD